GLRDPGKPAATGLPGATPKDQSKLVELKADADFAAKAEKIHRALAEGTAEGKAEADKIEEESQKEVRDRLGPILDGSGLIQTEPNAGQSKEATKEFLREIGENDKDDKKEKS
ncbi:MAG: hypothetical protein ACM3JD_09620, partial [Rudaea sp.]